MSFASEIEGFFVETETDVIDVLTAIKTGASATEKAIGSGLSWLANQTPAIATDVQTAESLVAAVAAVNPGVASNAEVQTAITQANNAVAALNAFATADKSGTAAPAALVQGYVAYANAAAAASSAKAAAAALPATTTTAAAA